MRTFRTLMMACLSVVWFVGNVHGASPEFSHGGEFSYAANDWPWWRGPQRNGTASPDQSPPEKWSDNENVLWKAPVPGRGHGSATVIGDQVFLQAAEPEKQIQSVLCFHRRTGEKLWQTQVHQGNFEVKGNAKSSHASSTPACDGERVFVNFLNNGAVYTTALNRDGKQIWQTKIADFVNHQGFGSSPAIYDSLVLVSADNKGTGGAIGALDRVTGRFAWRHERPNVPNYTSPIILNVAGKDQAIFIGCDLVSSFEPVSGKKLWEIEGATTECVTSTVTDGTHIITSGGYPKNHMSAVRADGSGKIAWENKSRVYVPSMLMKDGYLYAVLDEGIAMCWQADTGKEMWKGRLGGVFSASLVLVGDKIYAVNEVGHSYVFGANPREFKLIAQSQLGDETFATPTICGGNIFVRVATNGKDGRQEYLYCLGTGR